MEKHFFNLLEQDMHLFVRKFTKYLQKGDVLLLYGGLGAGKTTFARNLIRELMQDDTLDVPSPTFTLVQQYDTCNAEIWHFDLYRLSQPDEVIEIGFDEALTHGISLIEWPERLGRHLPKNRIECHIDFVDGDENLRNISLKASGSMVLRMNEWNINV